MTDVTARALNWDDFVDLFQALCTNQVTTVDILSHNKPWDYDHLTAKTPADLKAETREAIERDLNVPAGLISELIQPGSMTDPTVSSIASALREIAAIHDSIRGHLEVWRRLRRETDPPTAPQEIHCPDADEFHSGMFWSVDGNRTPPEPQYVTPDDFSDTKETR